MTPRDPAMAPRRRRRFERRPQNGPYTGPLPVRVIPRGIGAEEIREIQERALRPGAVWIRGKQRVRVVAAGYTRVTFKELNFGSAIRHCNRLTFLRNSRPEDL